MFVPCRLDSTYRPCKCTGGKERTTSEEKRMEKMKMKMKNEKMKHCIFDKSLPTKDFSLSAEVAQKHMPMSIVVDAERNHPTHLIKEGIKNQPDSQSTTV